MNSAAIKYYLLFLLLIGANLSQAQNFVSSGSIGSFKDAKSFSISPAGYIFVTDTTSNELIKIDTLGNVIKFIGGYGWQQSTFDNPTDVFATTLNVYVSDKNNNRVQFFDKDLNFLSQLAAENITDSRYVFNYPTCSAVSNQGDLFVLDSDNNRILKFNIRGEYQVTIGSFDAGSFSLSNPMNFAITRDARLLVVDPPNIIEFDQFGNGIKKIKFPFVPTNINATTQSITVNSKSQIAVFSNSDFEQGNFDPVIFNPKLDQEIMDTFLFGSKLYILTKSSILIYNYVKSE